MGPLHACRCPEASGAQGCGRIGGKGSAGPGEGSGSHEEEARNDAQHHFRNDDEGEGRRPFNDC